MVLGHVNENNLSGICAGLLSEQLSARVIYNILLEITACKIVEDCHQVVAINVNRHFSYFQDMAPVLSSQIFNNAFTAEELIQSTIGNGLTMLIADIHRDLAEKLKINIFHCEENSATPLIDVLPGVESLKSDLEIIMESCKFSRLTSKISFHLCEKALDQAVPKTLGCFLKKTSMSLALSECFRIAGRDAQLAGEMKKRLKGFINNIRFQLINAINDAISEFVFHCLDQICGLPEEAEDRGELALTA